MKPAARKTIAKQKKLPRGTRVNRGTLRSALLSNLKKDGGRTDINIRSATAVASRSSEETPIEERAGFPTKLAKGCVHPRNWITAMGVKIHVDYSRAAWLPDEWGQGVKQTQPTAKSTGGNGGILTTYVAPDGKSFFHKSVAEQYAGRQFTAEDGWNGQVRLAKLQARQGLRLARQHGSSGGLDTDEALFKLLQRSERRNLPPKDAFHVCIVSARRATKLEGVRDIFTVESQFLESGITPTWYVDEGSVQDYRKLGLTAVVGGKLCEARNRALRDARTKGKICVQCSDDISCWEYRDGPNAKERSDDAMNAAHNAARRLIVLPIAAARFIVAKMRSCAEPRPKLGGVYMLGSCARTFASDAFARHHFILGDFFVVEPDSTVKFDDNMKLKEDYDFTCGHIAAYGSIMRCNRMTLNVKHYSNTGGAVTNRDGKGEEERRNIAILQAKWPGMFRAHPKRKNEVILAWKVGRGARADDDGDDDDGEAEGGSKKRPSRPTATPTPTVKKVAAKRSPKPGETLRLQFAKVVRQGPKHAKASYIQARVAKVMGRVVGSIFEEPPSYMRDGRARKYGLADLKYDLAGGYIVLQRARG